MKKEVLIAIIIGFGLGLVITFGIWTANKALKEAAPSTTGEEEQEEVAAEPTPVPALDLMITSPEDNTLSDKEIIEVSGRTVAEAIITIIYPDGETILEADQDGDFSTEISLIGGDNQIKISAFDKEGERVSQTLTVVYSTAKI